MNLGQDCLNFNNQVSYKEHLILFVYREEGMDSMRSMVRGNGVADNYVLIAGENEYFYELDLTSGYVYKKNEVCY